MDRIQREEYPHLGGHSRLCVYPELKHSGRDYDKIWERRHWSLDLVLEHLAQYTAPRRVDMSGKISIYEQNYYVGKQHQGKIVSVMLDPLAVRWVILDDDGCELRSHPAEQLTRERIISLNVTHRRQKPR